MEETTPVADDLPRGALLMVLSAFLFAAMGEAVRMASLQLSNAMVVFFRNAFGLLARVSPFAAPARVVGVRPPLAGLPRLEIAAGTIAFVMVMIGTVTFDGLTQGSLWSDVGGALEETDEPVVDADPTRDDVGEGGI